MTLRQDSPAPAERGRNIRTVWRDTLALFVGPGRRFEADALAAAIGRSPDTVRRYLRGEGCPEWDTAVLILAALPPEFAAAVLRPAGLSGLRRIDGETSPAETLRELCEGAATLAAALADGRIDHTELPAIRRELTEAMVAISQFLAALEGGAAR